MRYGFTATSKDTQVALFSAAGVVKFALAMDNWEKLRICIRLRKDAVD
jgi:hypothetical protein